MRRRAVVFDCDGTLISSMEIVLQGLRQIFSEFLKREISFQEVEGFFHPQVEVIFSRLGIKDELTKKKLWKRWEVLTAHGKHRYKLFPGINTLLEELLGKGYELYVWTARDRKSSEEILSDLGVMGHFDGMRCADDCTPKPSPQGLYELLPDICKEDVIVIGDSYADIQGANDFGCASIGAIWCRLASKEALKGLGANYICAKVEDCLGLIEDYFYNQ